MNIQQEKPKAIIFGASKHGQRAFYSLYESYDIIAYSDNNQNLWGRELNGILVISPDHITDFGRNVTICVCIARHLGDVVIQLKKLGISLIKLMPYGIEYEYLNENPIPKIGFNKSYIKKQNSNNLAVLFVQDIPCARTRKISTALQHYGVETYMISTYLINDSAAFINEYVFNSFTELIDFVNNSEIDIVHSSNEPNEFTAVLTGANKALIHDVHDLVSMLIDPNIAELSLEYMSNVLSDGVMCTTNELAKMLQKKYQIQDEKLFVLGNYPLSTSALAKYPKFEKKDDAIHLAYSGSVLQSVRYRFDKIWPSIVSHEVHIHFFSNSTESSCSYLESISPYIHYEGNYCDDELIQRLSKYDCGLVYPNLEDDKQTDYINIASPNKMYEYLDAGLPLVVGNAHILLEFVEKYNCGGYLDINCEIYPQLKAISAINISVDFLAKYKMTMDLQAERIISFYKKTLRARSQV